MSELQQDVPEILHPVVRKLELEAIALYRAKFPDAPAWQELDTQTRCQWVFHAEKKRPKAPK
jgi:hypothetical protein